MRSPAPAAGGDMIRTFVALDFDPPIKQAITEYLQPLEKLADGISWVRSQKLHLTLKFLGDTQAAQIPELAVKFGEICSHYDSIQVQITGSGVFPNEKRPRVLWLGLKTETDALNQLANEIERACVHFGFQAESRAFAPHLTIGRVRSGVVTAVLKTMRDRPFESLDTIFRECVLMKSDLRPAGSIYTPLHKFPLARGGG
jgi:2'-5' RNA ligase